MTPHPKLRTILLILFLFALLLPLGGIVVLRLYENELIKRTETELISQTALIAACYKQVYLDVLEEIEDPEKRSNVLKANSILSSTPTATENADGLMPVLPVLDLANSPIHEPADMPAIPDCQSNYLALKAGVRLVPVIMEAKKTNLSGIRIMDYQGIVVASSGEDEGMSFAARQEVILALKGKPNSLLRKRHSDSPRPSLESISRGTRLRVFVALPIIIENQIVGAVVASRTPLDVAKALYASRFQMFKGAIFIVGAVLIMTILATLYIRRPVKALIRQVHQIKTGDRAGQVPIKNPAIEEVAQLSDAIAQMAFTLEQRADYIKTFAANVSHEFKTPLTSLHGAVEILKDHYAEMSSEERDNFLKIIDDETNHLDTLVKRLLELARAEVYQHDGTLTVIRPALDKIIERYANKKIKVQTHIDNQIQDIRMSPEVFNSIFYNLLDNSLFHNGDGCNVRINISRDQNDEQTPVRIVINDDGKGISTANASKVFRPFFTTARDKGGSGLGLTIIKSLIEAHGGSIELLPVAKGISFEIKLK